jgi:hypothetical protein
MPLVRCRTRSVHRHQRPESLAKQRARRAGAPPCPSTPSSSVQPARVTAVPRMRAYRARSPRRDGRREGQADAALDPSGREVELDLRAELPRQGALDQVPAEAAASGRAHRRAAALARDLQHGRAAARPVDDPADLDSAVRGGPRPVLGRVGRQLVEARLRDSAAGGVSSSASPATATRSATSCSSRSLARASRSLASASSSEVTCSSSSATRSSSPVRACKIVGGGDHAAFAVAL